MSVRRRNWVGPDGKPRSVWQIHVREVVGGKVIEVRRNSGLNDRKAAMREEQELRRQVLAGEYVLGAKSSAAPPSMPTVKEFADTFRAHFAVHNKHGTRLFYEQVLTSHVLPLVGKLPLDRVKAGTVAEVQNACLAKGLKPRTVNNVLRTFGRLMSLAFEHELIGKRVLVKRLPVARSKPKFLDFEEAEAFLKLVKETEENWYPMCVVAIRTGLRIGELIALRWTDVDFKGKRLLVCRAFFRGVESGTKSNESREVPLTEQALQALKDHRAKVGLRSAYVFSREGGERVSKNTVTGVFERLGNRLTGKRMGPHVLRHTFASHLVMRGVPLKVVSVLMGHSSVQITEIYAHLAPQVSRDAVLVLDRGLGK